jgi:hypothetical protein
MTLTALIQLHLHTWQQKVNTDEIGSAVLPVASARCLLWLFAQTKMGLNCLATPAAVPAGAM